MSSVCKIAIAIESKNNENVNLLINEGRRRNEEQWHDNQWHLLQPYMNDCLLVKRSDEIITDNNMNYAIQNIGCGKQYISGASCYPPRLDQHTEMHDTHTHTTITQDTNMS